MTATASTGSDARLDFSAFLALHSLSPFVLQATDPAAQTALNTTWQQVHGDLYLAWASDKNAYLNGDTGHTYSITDRWIADRTLFNSLLLERNAENGDNHFLNKSLTEDWRLVDVQTNTTLYLNNSSNEGPATESYPKRSIVFGGNGADQISGHDFYADRLYGGAGNDRLSGLGGADHLEGNEGSDALDGGAGNDTLHGGAGADELSGGAGNDHLIGGAGSDIYVLDGSAGDDVVIDQDGGTIRYLDNVLAGGTQTSPGAQEWQDEHVTYRLIEDGTKQHLLIIAGAGTLAVREWTPGHFGIQLQGHEAPTPVEPQTLFAGDLVPVDQNPQAEGVQVGYDTLGNVIVHASQAEPNRADVLYDSAADDELRGHGGDDTLDAIRGGNDLLDGGAGSDHLRAGEGDDTLVGGEGLDRLLGQAGDDRLFAEAEQSNAEVVADHEEGTEDGNNAAGQGELRSGGVGEDWQVGGRRVNLFQGTSRHQQRMNSVGLRVRRSRLRQAHPQFA